MTHAKLLAILGAISIITFGAAFAAITNTTNLQLTPTTDTIKATWTDASVDAGESLDNVYVLLLDPTFTDVIQQTAVGFGPQEYTFLNLNPNTEYGVSVIANIDGINQTAVNATAFTNALPAKRETSGIHWYAPQVKSLEYNGNLVKAAKDSTTPMELVKVNAGELNTAVVTLTKEMTQTDVKVVQIAFGLKTGNWWIDYFNTAPAIIEYDRSYRTVNVIGPLTNVSVTEKDCGTDCLSVTFAHTFLEPLKYNVVAVGTWDYAGRSSEARFNDGVYTGYVEQVTKLPQIKVTKQITDPDNRYSDAFAQKKLEQQEKARAYFDSSAIQNAVKPSIQGDAYGDHPRMYKTQMFKAIADYYLHGLS